MKILLIGGRGTLGKTVYHHFAGEHQVMVAGRSGGDFLVDIASAESIESMFKQTGNIDAVICTAGEAKWADFNTLSEEDYYHGIRSKLMGQVNLVRMGQHHINPGGSITLTTGILADDPVPGTTAAALVNGALHSFVKAVALEIPNGIRVNVVAPGLVEDSYVKYKSYFPGHVPVPMTKVAMGYERSVLGKDCGKVIRVYTP